MAMLCFTLRDQQIEYILPWIQRDIRIHRNMYAIHLHILSLYIYTHDIHIYILFIHQQKTIPSTFTEFTIQELLKKHKLHNFQNPHIFHCNQLDVQVSSLKLTAFKPLKINGWVQMNFLLGTRSIFRGLKAVSFREGLFFFWKVYLYPRPSRFEQVVVSRGPKSLTEIWVFPKIGVPPNHGVSLFNHPFWGTRNAHIYQTMEETPWSKFMVRSPVGFFHGL